MKKRNQNELLSKKYKNICKTLNYIDHLPIEFPQLLYVFPFLLWLFLVGIPIGIKTSATELIFLITAGIKKDKSINKTKKKKHKQRRIACKTSTKYHRSLNF